MKSKCNVFLPYWWYDWRIAYQQSLALTIFFILFKHFHLCWLNSIKVYTQCFHMNGWRGIKTGFNLFSIQGNTTLPECASVHCSLSISKPSKIRDIIVWVCVCAAATSDEQLITATVISERLQDSISYIIKYASSHIVLIPS